MFQPLKPRLQVHRDWPVALGQAQTFSVEATGLHAMNSIKRRRTPTTLQLDDNEHFLHAPTDARNKDTCQ
jgi:hypothetical protein